MKLKKFRLLAVAAVAVTLTLIVVSGAGAQSVGEDAYVVGDIAISPSSTACIGGSITLSGGGAPASTEIAVIMVHSPGEFPSAVLGFVASDADGNWSLSTTVPTTGINGEGADTAIIAGEYSVIAGDQAETYLAASTLTVTDCSVAAVTTLPATGFPIAGVGLASAAAMALAGLGLRRRQK